MYKTQTHYYVTIFENVFIVLSFLGRSVQGPGSDSKYKSEKEKEYEENTRRGKRKKLLTLGLGGGLLIGAALGYKASQTAKKPQISNDSVTKDYILENKPPYFR